MFVNENIQENGRCMNLDTKAEYEIQIIENIRIMVYGSESNILKDFKRRIRNA